MMTAERMPTMTADERQPLSGCRIFLLEDEALVSMMVEAMVEELGCEIVATLGHIDRALAFIEAQAHQIDVALIDVNISGQRSYEVARRLSEHAIPFVFSSGYDDRSIVAEWRTWPRLEKPFQIRELEAALVGVVGPLLRSSEK